MNIHIVVIIINTITDANMLMHSLILLSSPLFISCPRCTFSPIYYYVCQLFDHNYIIEPSLASLLKGADRVCEKTVAFLTHANFPA